jgi:hypothetical protein
MGRGSNGSLPTCPLDTANGFATSYTIGALVTAPVCLQNTNHVLN